MAQEKMSAAEYRRRYSDKGQLDAAREENIKMEGPQNARVPDQFAVRRKLFIGGKEPTKESRVQMQVSKYMRSYYPRAEFHVDQAGRLNGKHGKQDKLSQKRRGWQDFRIYDWSGEAFCGLFLELKRAADESGRPTRLHKVKGGWANTHLQEQADCIAVMRKRRRASGFTVGLAETLAAIDYYFAQDYTRLIPLLERHDAAGKNTEQ